MITVKISDPGFHNAYWRAQRAFPIITLEQPRQYFQRWYKTYRCRIMADSVVFDNDADYTAFMLKFS